MNILNILNKYHSTIDEVFSTHRPQKDKELKKLNDLVKELVYEKRAQESSLNLTITCLKDELRKTEAARAFAQKWRSPRQHKFGIAVLKA